MPSVFTVSNFQRADRAKSDHKANASRQREETEAEMSGRRRLKLCTFAAITTKVTRLSRERT